MVAKSKSQYHCMGLIGIFKQTEHSFDKLQLLHFPGNQLTNGLFIRVVSAY